jgi:hypothetical protein
MCAGAPIELIALSEPYAGVICARRANEPGFSHVNGISGAIMAALGGGEVSNPV